MPLRLGKYDAVTTLRVVWIEICLNLRKGMVIMVTTLRVVWIEIVKHFDIFRIFESPPCGWCGLKYQKECIIVIRIRHHLAGGVD